MSFLPEADQDYLSKKALHSREVVENGKKGIVFIDYILPVNKFDREKVDLLILLPNGYSDIPPDMFYIHPGIFLMPDKKLPKKTQVNISFEQKQWQRWSRHSPNNNWRPGIDGIHTYLKKIETALKTATAE
ncbi:MAG: E2/UBC family protein [Dissulfuribacterales bacterium]